MSTQLIYALLFFVPFILLLMFVFFIFKKLIKIGLVVLVLAVISFFVFSIKISPLDYIFHYNQNMDGKVINLGKYTITFGQIPSEKFYRSYVKIIDNDTKKENTIVLDPENGKYWNVDIVTNGNNICLNNFSKTVFCIDKSNWNITYQGKQDNLQNLVQ